MKKNVKQKATTKSDADLKSTLESSLKAARQKLKTKSGTELTPALEADLVAEAEAGFDPAVLIPRKVGRPALSPRQGSAHRVDVRLDDATYQALQEAARESHRTPSELVREAIQAAYLKKAS